MASERARGRKILQVIAFISLTFLGKVTIRLTVRPKHTSRESDDGSLPCSPLASRFKCRSTRFSKHDNAVDRKKNEPTAKNVLQRHKKASTTPPVMETQAQDAEDQHGHETNVSIPLPQQFAPLLVTRQQAATLLCMSLRSLDAHRAAGRIGQVRAGGKILLRPVDLDAFIARHVIPPREMTGAI